MDYKKEIEELRAHTLEQRAARKSQKGTAGIKPPPGEATVETVELSAGELQICKDTGCDPKEYVRLKAKRDGGDGSYFQALRDRDAAAQALIAKVGN